MKDAAAAARLVLERTQHTLLAGDQATRFALEMGLSAGPANLSTPESAAQHRTWLEANCQPNYRRNVSPDPEKYCGPYRVSDTPTAAGATGEGAGTKTGTAFESGETQRRRHIVDSGLPPAPPPQKQEHQIPPRQQRRQALRQPFKRASADVNPRDNHDTIAMFATDAAGLLFGATSTNGARGKIPGRVGDSPIPGEDWGSQ